MDDHYDLLSKQDRELRAEAVSTKHLLRHKLYNKSCEACLKSKMNERRHMTGFYNRDPKRWGEPIILCPVRTSGLAFGVSELRLTSKTFVLR